MMSRSRLNPFNPARAGLAALLLLTAATGCQRGEKSCRYYSIVLERSDAPDERRHALEEIKKLNTKDQLKCDDDKVFERIGKAMDNTRLRTLTVDTLESMGKSGGKLRERAEKMLVTGLAKNEGAGQIATVFRSWRLESAEGKDPWAPTPATTNALAAAIKRITGTQQGAGQARAQLVEALFLAVTDPKERIKYEDLLIELADTDPAQQSVDVNIKALNYLAEMRSQNEKTFATYVHGLYAHDAARAETFMAARLALATFPREKVAQKVIGILQQKDAEFEAWAKQANLFDWEWKEGPKTMQLLVDTHVPSAAQAIVSVLGKPVHASDADAPKEWKLINKSLPWGGYLISRFQLSTWALASMGRSLEPVAEQLGAIALNADNGLEQRSFPLLGLAISGANNAWPTVLKVYKGVGPQRGEFVQSLLYAVDTQNLDEFNAMVVADKDEQVQKAVTDPTAKSAIKVVEECKKAEDGAAADGKQSALALCYAGFLGGTDAVAKQKAAIGLVHMGARGFDVTKALIVAFEKASPAQDGITLRQILMAGLRNQAKPEHLALLYHAQQLQVQDLPSTQSWIWDFDVLMGQLLPEAEKAGTLPTSKGAPAAAPAAAPQGGGAPVPAPAEVAPAGMAPVPAK